MKRSPHRLTLAALAALACSIAVLVGASTAPGDIVAPVVTLGPVTVANGVATLSGTVAATQPSSLTLNVNGQPLELTESGTFSGVVNLGGQSNLSIAVANPSTGEVSTVNIPLTTNLIGPGGVISPDVLSRLEEAAVSLTRPLGGFVSVGREPITVSGGVGNRDQLASLSVGGVDALSALHPNGGFTIPVPGTSKEISVLMTDRQGVSLQTSIPTANAAFVSATNAVGVRISKVRYYAKKVKTTKRLRIVVTVKDKIRGAKVSVKSLRRALVRGATKVRKTNRSGQVSFVMRLRTKAFGKRFVVVTTAKTPSAKAAKRSSLRLPRLKQSAGR